MNEDIEFNEDASKEDLLTITNSWLEEGQTYHELLKKHQDKMIEYYRGNQTEMESIPEFDSDAVYNRQFEAIETLVPIVTGSAHQFLGLPAGEDDASKERAKKIQMVLNKKYYDLDVKGKLEVISRHMMTMRFGVLKWGWNYEMDDVDVWDIDPRLIIVPKLRLHPRRLPWVAEIQEYDREEWEGFFTDKGFDDFKSQSLSNSGVDKKGKESAQAFEISTPTYKIWRTDGEILKEMVNPYFDFEGEEEEVKETDHSGKVKVKTYNRLRNHLQHPRINYVFFAPFRTGDAPFSHTSLMEVSTPIQDDINKQKRLITNNLNTMGNGQWVVDSDAMTQEESDNLTNEPGLVVRGKNLASENRVRRQAGTPIPNGHFVNLQESIQAFDNIFGTHGALRGSGQSDTLGGQILNRQQDLSRIQQLTEVINIGLGELVDGLVQVMKMFYEEQQILPIVGPEGMPEVLKFSREDIEDNVVIETKSGNPIALDPQQKFNQAIQLWQLQALDPETLYERLEFPNPQLASQKLAAWRAGQLLLESQIKGNAERQTQEANTGTSGNGGERDVETSNDVVARASESLGGGGTAPLSNTPNQ